MSKCLRCGAALPDAGDCPRCAPTFIRPAEGEARPGMAALLDRDLHLDRRGLGEREPAGPFSGGLMAASTLLPEPPALSGGPAALGGAPPTEPAAPVGGVEEVHAAPAPLWRRLLSFTLDALAIVALATVYLALGSWIGGFDTGAPEMGTLDALAHRARSVEPLLLPGAILIFLLALTYCAVAAFVWDGRTLGRRAAGIKLVDRHGLAPSPTRAIIRALLSGVSFLLFLGGFWLAFFDRRGQTLHDKLTSTFVVLPS